MKLDTVISNLGKFRNGTIKIRPITIIAGKNGTGKSFVTKTLYSFLNVINKNVYYTKLQQEILECRLLIQTIPHSISHVGIVDISLFKNLEVMLLHVAEESANGAANLELRNYFDFTKSLKSAVSEIQSLLAKYVEDLSKKRKKKNSIENLISLTETNLSKINNLLENGESIYPKLIQEALIDELKENFQISDLTQLIAIGEKSASLNIKGLASVELKGSDVTFSITHEFINKVAAISSVVFFESPAYWRVRDALNAAKNLTNNRFNFRNKSRNLTGVPKYFYELDKTLSLNPKDRYSDEIGRLIKELETSLGGEFEFKGDNLVFKDYKTNVDINKNLISFGMTNIGMILALLKKNVISKGSFVFIDEPEANLHPEWQALLSEILINLAKNNVNVVITTHSTDMLKSIEVMLKDRENIDDDFLSVHYFDDDGTLLNFESKNINLQLLEATTELSSTYQKLYISGLKNNDR